MVVPTKDRDKFDILSLSLVRNYVPAAEGRGQMLRRTRAFLKAAPAGEDESLFPCLFLVLPAPCVTNSRYLDGYRLTEMMNSIGYKLLRTKLSAKLVYYLWKYEEGSYATPVTFPKKEVNPGRDRNNFCITLSGAFVFGNVSTSVFSISRPVAQALPTLFLLA